MTDERSTLPTAAPPPAPPERRSTLPAAPPEKRTTEIDKQRVPMAAKPYRLLALVKQDAVVRVQKEPDDTVLTCAVADALLHDRDIVESLRDWARRIKLPAHLGGYGQRFIRWVAAPTPQPAYGSYGNGVAMRVSPVAWLSDTLEDALALSDRVTGVTHDHPEGLKGALATVHAIWLARQGADPETIRTTLADIYDYDLSRGVDAIRATYQYTESCQGTVPEAIVCALEATDFEDALRNAVSLGGDADTLAAIAGAIAEARFGIPETLMTSIRTRLPEAVTDLLELWQQRMFNRGVNGRNKGDGLCKNPPRRE